MKGGAHGGAPPFLYKTAERFAADSQAAAAGALAYQEDGLAVSVAVTEEAHAAGCLLEATITVSGDDEVLVTLDTARYVRDGEAAAAGSGGSTVAAVGSAAAGGNGASGDAGAATPGAAERRVE